MTDDCDAKVLGAPEAKIVQTKEVDYDQPLLVCCFPSAGVVGTIAANTLIEQFEMKEVAHLRSKHIPSAALFLDGRLRHPFRVYGDKKRNLLVVTGELPIAEEGLYAVSSAILDWGASVGARETVILDGIPVQGLPSERKVLYAAEEEKLEELGDIEGMEILSKGIISGIAGSILAETLCRSMVGFALLTPAIAVIPDPDGAVKLLEALGNLYKIDVPVKELEESGEEIRKKMEKVAEQVDGMRRQQQATGRTGFERMYA
ncbi:proteasome assembly chaperone family protein [Candidatus Thorarchaeota archaeon]|jgi:uncharacterized protein|nr:MAG: proteasome assembly chaperone family protein [Candidatus Thorarchaeota archaeon]